MQRYNIFSIICLLILTIASPVFGQTISELKIISDFTIPIVVDEETAIESIDMEFSGYDINRFELTEITLTGGILENENFQMLQSITDDKITLVIYRSGALTGKGKVAFIHFAVKSSGNTILSFTRFEINEKPALGGFYINNTSAQQVKVLVNYAPVVDNTLTPMLTPINEDSTENTGNTVSEIIPDDAITDADDALIKAIAVVQVDNTNGRWQYSVDNGVMWTDFSATTGEWVDMSDQSRLLDSSHNIRFVPNPNWHGTAAFTFRAWDKSSGTAGETADTGINGGISSFSADSDEAEITVSPVNDAPVLDNTGSMILNAIKEEISDAENTGTQISSIIASAGGDRITDVDGDPEGIAVIATDNTNGSWQYKRTEDTEFTDFPADLSEDNAMVFIDTDVIRFIPDENYNGTITDGIMFRAWDQSDLEGFQNLQGLRFDTTVNGGKTSFSTAIETASITVGAANDPPVITEDSITVDMDEDGRPIPFALSLQCTDADSDTLFWAVSNIPGYGKAAVAPCETSDTSKACVSYTPNNDYNGTDSFSIQVSDSISTDTVTVNLNIRPVNDAPKSISLSNTRIAENKPAETVVGTFSATDADVGDTHTYKLVSGSKDDDNAMFVIEQNTLKTKQPIDYETKQLLSIRVRAEDNSGAFLERPFFITVTDANDLPTNIMLDNTSMAENQPSGTVVGNLSATDQDADEQFVFSLVSGEGSTGNAAFTINSNSLMTNRAFDYEQQNSYSVRIRVTDSKDGWFEKVFTLTITDENEVIGYQVSGKIMYYSGERPVPGVLLSLESSEQVYTTETDENGEYVFTEIPAGDYTLTPSYDAIPLPDDLALSAADISNMEKFIFNKTEFTEYQQIAGDVSLNGEVTGMDISRVIRFGIGLITQLNDEGIFWVFDPASSAYISLDSDKANQDFTAILLGDVSGNWQSPQNTAFRSGSQRNDLSLLESQNFTLSSGETLAVPVILDVESLLFEGADLMIHFDGNVLNVAGMTIQNSILENDGCEIAFNTVQEQGAQDNRLSAVIFSRSLVPRLELENEKLGIGNEKDSRVIAEILFEIVGQPGDSTNLSFSKLACNEVSFLGSAIPASEPTGGFYLNDTVSQHLNIAVAEPENSNPTDFLKAWLEGIFSAIQR